MEVQVVPPGEVWIWNALPYAVSQFKVTWQIDWVEPRSTSSHCGSEKALDQRVPRFPSTASAAVKLAFSSEDAVAVLFSARFVVPQLAAGAAGAAGAAEAAGTVLGSTSPVRISDATAASKSVLTRRGGADLARLRPGLTALSARAARRRGGARCMSTPPGCGGPQAWIPVGNGREPHSLTRPVSTVDTSLISWRNLTLRTHAVKGYRSRVYLRPSPCVNLAALLRKKLVIRCDQHAGRGGGMRERRRWTVRVLRRDNRSVRSEEHTSEL